VRCETNLCIYVDSHEKQIYLSWQIWVPIFNVAAERQWSGWRASKSVTPWEWVEQMTRNIMVIILRVIRNGLFINLKFCSIIRRNQAECDVIMECWVSVIDDWIWQGVDVDCVIDAGCSGCDCSESGAIVVEAIKIEQVWQEIRRQKWIGIANNIVDAHDL
jgi:hypothetical protein